ncbi:metallophosphoesterase family protein [Kosmotoga pacifica]|uniref:Calcineurin-like phosphoesterase domain-containing protein n=1 Tax=Kosmotoga pacifica TaxID=1330330 RepID=A0A0G2Z996_9BACT|nr:metallophosphoesterase [Kosmotoga pacifica]AKI96646.1 hypothetical protein IX53_01090 [Kosmotoga pacifica]
MKMLFVILFFVTISMTLPAVVITSPATNTVQFSWYTTTPVVCNLYVYNEHFSKEVFESEPSKFHVLTVSDLFPDVSYRYRIECVFSTDYVLEGNFSIPFNPGNHFKFVVYGDSRSNPGIHLKVTKVISSKEPLFVLHTGDIVYSDACINDWANLFKATEPLSNVLFFPAIGNHEKKAENYKAFFSLPGNESYYSFKIGELLFIVLNTNERFDWCSDQYKWLESLVMTNIAEFTIVMFHHPPFSYNSYLYSYFVKIILVPLFEKYGVDLVLSGHDHNYQRVEHNGLTYIVTGGGGAFSYDAKNPLGPIASFKGYHFVLFEYDNGTLKGTCYDIKGQEIDSFFVSPH